MCHRVKYFHCTSGRGGAGNGKTPQYLWSTYGLSMDYLWTTYGTTPEQHRTNTVAIPCQFVVSRTLESRWGWQGFAGSHLDWRSGGWGSGCRPVPSSAGA